MCNENLLMEAGGHQSKSSIRDHLMCLETPCSSRCGWEAVPLAPCMVKVHSQYTKSLCLIGSWGEKGQVTCLRSHSTSVLEPPSKIQAAPSIWGGGSWRRLCWLPHPPPPQEELAGGEEGKQCSRAFGVADVISKFICTLPWVEAQLLTSRGVSFRILQPARPTLGLLSESRLGRR